MPEQVLLLQDIGYNSSILHTFCRRIKGGKEKEKSHIQVVDPLFRPRIVVRLPKARAFNSIYTNRQTPKDNET